MNVRLKIYFVLLSIFLFFNINASARSIAFSYFINESGNASYDYLEKILPNSIAAALNNKYGIDVQKPAQISAVNRNANEKIKKEPITEEQLENIIQNINAEYFIYGTFKPLGENRIKLDLNVHKKGTFSVFQFENTGYLETEIFRLVDKIAIQIKNITNESQVYRLETIREKSKLAILTNLSGEELNTLHYEFLKSGYRISPTQVNDLATIIDDRQIRAFYHFSGMNASYHLIHRKKDIELLTGTWAGTEYNRKILEDRKALEKYTFNYSSINNEMITRIRSFKADVIDYLIVIGFNRENNSAWIRCLNVKENRFITAETGISGANIEDITRKIIISLTSELSGNS